MENGRDNMNYLDLGGADRACYRDEHLTMDLLHGQAQLDSRELVLTRKEKELLSLLVSHAGEIIPRDELLMRVWGYSREIRTRTLDVHIRRLRKKLGPYSDVYIETIFGVGYRFQRYHEPRVFSNSLSTLLPATA